MAWLFCPKAEIVPEFIIVAPEPLTPTSIVLDVYAPQASSSSTPSPVYPSCFIVPELVRVKLVEPPIRNTLLLPCMVPEFTGF